MGFRDLVLFYVVTGVSLRWIATAAAAGPSSIIIWIGAFLLLLLPTCALGHRALLALSRGRRDLCLGEARRSEILPASSPPGHIGSATCPTSLPCFTSPPAMRFTFATTGAVSPNNTTYYIVFSLVALTLATLLNIRRAQRGHVAAQPGRARHVDSGRHHRCDGGGCLASLRSGDFVHACIP